MDDKETCARAVAAAAGIQAIERTRRSLVEDGVDEGPVRALADRIAEPYRRRLLELTNWHENPDESARETRLCLMFCLAALEAEREAIWNLQAVRTIDQATVHRLLREIDFAEAAQRESASLRDPIR